MPPQPARANALYRESILSVIHSSDCLLTLTCFGLPQQHDGSPGKRRHVRLRMVVVALGSGQCQRRVHELQRHGSEPAEWRQPSHRAPCALRPASTAAFLQRIIYICSIKQLLARSGGSPDGSGQCGRRFSNPRPKRPVLERGLSKNRGSVYISVCREEVLPVIQTSDCFMCLPRASASA